MKYALIIQEQKNYWSEEFVDLLRCSNCQESFWWCSKPNRMMIGQNITHPVVPAFCPLCGAKSTNNPSSMQHLQYLANQSRRGSLFDEMFLMFPFKNESFANSRTRELREDIQNSNNESCSLWVQLAANSAIGEIAIESIEAGKAA